MRKRLMPVLLIAIPLAIFVGIHLVTSWRPQKLITIAGTQAVSISQDGRRIACANKNQVEVTELATGHRVSHKIFSPTHLKSIDRTAFSPDAQKLAVVWGGFTEYALRTSLSVLIIDSSGKLRPMAPIVGLSSPEHATELQFSSDSSAIWLATTGNARCWDVKSGRLISQLKKESRASTSSSFPFQTALSSDGREFYASWDDGYQVFETRSGKRLVRTTLPRLADGSIVFGQDNNLLAHENTANVDGTYSVRNARTGQHLWKAKGEPKLMAFGNLYAQTSAGQLTVYEASTGRMKQVLSIIPEESEILQVEPDSILILNKKGQLFRQRLFK